jgi:hypothetical protein
MTVDPARCPLCGEDNACGVARGAGTCWCFSTKIPDDVLARVPLELRNIACVCERCASGGERAAREITEAPDSTG